MLLGVFWSHKCYFRNLEMLSYNFFLQTFFSAHTVWSPFASSILSFLPSFIPLSLSLLLLSLRASSNIGESGSSKPSKPSKQLMQTQTHFYPDKLKQRAISPKRTYALRPSSSLCGSATQCEHSHCLCAPVNTPRDREHAGKGTLSLSSVQSPLALEERNRELAALLG